VGEGKVVMNDKNVLYSQYESPVLKYELVHSNCSY
jgi:hypothetical protein